MTDPFEGITHLDIVQDPFDTFLDLGLLRLALRVVPDEEPAEAYAEEVAAEYARLMRDTA